MRKNKRYWANHPRCKNCYWIPSCPIWAEHQVDPDVCTEYLPFEVVYQKPNFWLYLAGDLTLCAACVLFGWLGLKYDNAAAFFIVGAFSVMASNVTYEYQQRKIDYWRYLREVQHDV